MADVVAEMTHQMAATHGHVQGLRTRESTKDMFSWPKSLEPPVQRTSGRRLAPAERLKPEDMPAAGELREKMHAGNQKSSRIECVPKRKVIANTNVNTSQVFFGDDASELGRVTPPATQYAKPKEYSNCAGLESKPFQRRPKSCTGIRTFLGAEDLLQPQDAAGARHEERSFNSKSKARPEPTQKFSQTIAGMSTQRMEEIKDRVAGQVRGKSDWLSSNGDITSVNMLIAGKDRNEQERRVTEERFLKTFKGCSGVCTFPMDIK